MAEPMVDWPKYPRVNIRAIQEDRLDDYEYGHVSRWLKDPSGGYWSYKPKSKTLHPVFNTQEDVDRYRDLEDFDWWFTTDGRLHMVQKYVNEDLCTCCTIHRDVG